MALLHKATLTPSKRELMDAWLPTRPWATGDAADLRPVGAYRFDDPDGEVGLEGFLLGGVDGSVLHLPLTYRAAPLEGGEQHLVGTCEHSVLGPRWVYDGCADPVFVRALAATVLTGGTESEQFFEVDGRREVRESSATVVGSGRPGTPVPEIGAVHCRDDGPTTVVRAGDLELVVVRAVGADVHAEHTLTGRWAGDWASDWAGDRAGGAPAVLAGVRRA